MAKRTGYLRCYRPGIWHMYIHLGYTPEGKRLRKCVTFRGSRKDAEKELRRLVAASAGEEHLDAPRTTFADVAREWLQDRALSVAPKTYVEYENKLRLYVLPHIGKRAVESVGTADVERLYTWVVLPRPSGGLGLSPTTAGHVHRIVHAIFQLAMRRGYVAKNPASGAVLPRRRAGNIEVLTAEQVKRLLREADGSRAYIPIILAITAGLRRSEVLGLKWEDVDLEAGTLTVRRAVTSVNGQIHIRPPKTARGSRTVTLPPTAVNELRAYRAVYDHYTRAGRFGVKDGWLCCDERGALMTPATLTSLYSRIAKSAGVPTGFHLLRHTHVSMLLAAGHSVALVSRRVGHASIAITADVYGHLQPSEDERAAQIVDSTIFNNSQTTVEVPCAIHG